ncbi:MAG: MFS transporter [Candidatus Andeanibacterium colombiense]|uniref:MFS transporter n=1 Tax=Candidatus Andeanibacterium colombiense TaxID=3121345 RepID=A0AAJ5X6D0_9SPHN|nr:MAG: MFS transporter [Sphingomonadaceae bacterium]
MSEQAPASAQPDGLPKPRRYWAIAAISFGTALFVVDGAIANVALPTIARELGVGDGAVTNVVTVYQLVLVMLLLPFSSLGDRMGHRRFYQFGQVVFLIASAATIFAHNFALLLAVRALQALGAAMALSVSAAMLREIYPIKRLGSGMGINSVIVASSSALAPTMGGYIVAHLDWRWVFVVAAPLAAFSLLLGRSLPEPVRQDREPETVSGVWSALTVLLLIGGLQLAMHGAAPELGAALAMLGVVSAWFLVKRERQRSHPVVPVDLLAMPVIGLSALGAVCAFIASGSLMLALPFRFQGVMGYSPDEVGLLLLPFPLTMLVVAPLAGWLSDRIAPTKLGITGMAIAIAGLVLMATMPVQPGAFGISWRLSLCALGFGLFFAPNSRLLIGRAPRHRSAAAGGLLSTARLGGQTLAAAAIGILLAQGLGTGRSPLVLSAAFAVVAALCSLARFRSARANGGLTIGKRSADQAVDPAI